VRRRLTFEGKAAELRGRLNANRNILGLDEIPLSLKEASVLWGQSPDATRRYFLNVEGVRKIVSPESRLGGRKRRRYTTLLIPPSILAREIRKVTVVSTDC
jgi:hypothetical protein